MQRLQVNRRSLLRTRLAEYARGALLQLALPLRDLVGMNVELLGQLGQAEANAIKKNA